MNGVVVLFCLTFFIYTQAKPAKVKLSNEEEDCIVQTGINRELVIQDKRFSVKKSSPVDPKFNDYLGCYKEKLIKAGKLSQSKQIFSSVPGYKTRHEIKTLWCDENGAHPSGLEYPCVERNPPYLDLGAEE